MKAHIVIIGGMGPQASVILHKHILDRAITDGARHADEFPEITHLSLPIPDFISSSDTVQQAIDLIASRLERLYCWR